jgi:hypothetical protein
MSFLFMAFIRSKGGLTLALSADAVAGNGHPLSYLLRSPSADAVAGGSLTLPLTGFQDGLR